MHCRSLWDVGNNVMTSALYIIHLCVYSLAPSYFFFRRRAKSNEQSGWVCGEQKNLHVKTYCEWACCHGGAPDCHLPPQRPLFGLWLIAGHPVFITGDSPQHEGWIITGLLTEILRGFDLVLLLLHGKTANLHLQLVTKVCVTHACWLRDMTWNTDSQLLLLTSAACALPFHALFVHNKNSLGTCWSHLRLVPVLVIFSGI